MNRYPVPNSVIILTETDAVKQLQTLGDQLRLDTTTRLFSKCIRCNVALAAIADKTTIRDRVNANVYSRHERFFTCPSCGTVFWRGSHVRNTCAKLGTHCPP